MPLIFPSIEFFEDMVDFLYFDPWPLVRNTDDLEFVVFLCRDPDGPISLRVKLRVGDKVN
jgi:hypothetical protein